MKPNAEKPLIVQIIHSFRYAAVGLRVLCRDRNMLVHLLACVAVTVMGFWLKVSVEEWAILVLAASLVMGLEAMNSAIEFAVDLASPEFHELAAKAKDVASASVLIAALGAMIVGAILFLPRLLN